MKTMHLRMIALLSCLLFPISGFGQSPGMRGQPPRSDRVCTEPGTAEFEATGLRAACGLAGQPHCPWDPPCGDMKTFNFRDIAGFCGRTSRPDGVPIELGARGHPPREGSNCGTGLIFFAPAGLCVECGRLGLRTCPAADGDLACWEPEGVPSRDGQRCVRKIATAYDLQGTWRNEQGHRIFIQAQDNENFTAKYTNIANSDIFVGTVSMRPPVTVQIKQYWINQPDPAPPNGIYDFTQAAYDHLAGTVKARRMEPGASYFPAKPWVLERVPN